MNDEDRKSVLALENFIKKTKGNKIQIRQPIKIKYQDIFNEEEKDNSIEIKSQNIKDKLRATNRPNFIKIKKYNVIKESIIFKELDSKKSILSISNNKDEYNNFLFDCFNNNNKINSKEILYSKKTDYFIRKSTINYNELYESKLKNVRNTYNILIIFE